ncbi:MAG: MmcQ/YjbR family DNA-binding protein [bacterium]|nr:MmcQ/YjbR family DNA-binding protein [bacterium]
MEHHELRDLCLSLRGATEDLPFGPDTLVFRVMDKMFALMPAQLAEGQPPQINLKCDPTLAIILRQQYEAVQPGYHMNKTHWNTVVCDGSIPDDEIREMIEHSYDLIVGGLTKKQRQQLEAL